MAGLINNLITKIRQVSTTRVKNIQRSPPFFTRNMKPIKRGKTRSRILFCCLNCLYLIRFHLSIVLYVWVLVLDGAITEKNTCEKKVKAFECVNERASHGFFLFLCCEVSFCILTCRTWSSRVSLYFLSQREIAVLNWIRFILKGKKTDEAICWKK